MPDRVGGDELPPASAAESAGRLPDLVGGGAPLHVQVADALRAAIRAQVLRPGDRVPGENRLRKRYGVSQWVAREALATLADAGAITKRPKVGTFVRERPAKRVRHIPPRGTGTGSAYAESMLKAGREPSTRLVRAELGPPAERVAELLDLAPGEQTLIRRRHMFADGSPMQLATSYIPASVAGGVDLAYPDTGPTGIYRRLAERGHRVVRFVEEIEDRHPDHDEATFLRLGTGEHVLELVRLAYDRNGRVLDAVVNTFAANAWRLTYAWEAES